MFNQKQISMGESKAGTSLKMAAAAAFGIYGAWFSSLPLSLDFNDKKQYTEDIDYSTSFQKQDFKKNNASVNRTSTFNLKADSVENIKNAENKISDKQLESFSAEQNETALKVARLQKHLTAPWGWIHSAIQLLGILLLSIPGIRSSVKEIKNGYFGISNQIMAGIAFPTVTGFYNLATNSLIPCCIAHMAFLKNIQVAAGSSVNFTGFLFATSGAAVLTAISFLSESIESYIERYSQKQIEKILANDRLSQNYLVKIDKVWVETAVDDIETRNDLKIRYGEAVPVDGILKTDALVMRDQLTGEADEISLKAGEKILAGTIIKGRNGAEIQAVAVGNDTSLAKIRQIALEVAQNKSNAATQVEKFAKWFSPIITGLSLIGFLYGAYVGSYFYIIYSLSLVFVFTPCALKLSVPALTATFLLKFSKKKNIFIKNFSAFENAAKVKAVFFDKTGTLVSHEKKMIDQKIVTDAELVYALIEKMTQSSNHPVSKFLNQEAQKNWQGDFANPRLTQMAEIEGQGFVAQWNEQNVLFGNEKLLREQGFLAEQVAQFGEFSNYLVVGQNIVAGFLLEGKLRPDAIETVSALQKTGKKVFILSGDRKDETKRVARLLNIPEEQALGQLSDDEKMEKVAAYKENFGLTMFVGDGINDAKALAQADLGVAWNAQNLAAENADIIAFEDNGLKRITEIFDEQKRYNRLLMQNIFFPLITNSVLLFTIVSGTFSSLLLSIGGPLLSGFTLPIAFLIHESVSFMAAGNSMRGYLDSSFSLIANIKRLISKHS